MENTTLCYLEKDGCYLMLHRIKKKNDVNHDKWIGVGGHFEENESPEDCVKREVLEETGYTMQSPEYRGIVTFISDQCAESQLMHLFTCTSFTGTQTDCNEGTLEWVKKEHISSLPLWEGDKIFFRLLEKEKKIFSLKLCYQGDLLSLAVLNGQVILHR